MKEKKIILAQDLGPGDGGKGGTVHKICSAKSAHTVIKRGGGQGSHGVRTAKGQSFNFSHFGCGTFEGVRTYISPLMVISPNCLLNEADSLKYEHGVCNVDNLITVDREALCATPFHRIASQLRELARKDNPRGTIGKGIGETVLDAETCPELAIRAGDIEQPDLQDRVEAVRQRKIKDLSEITDNVGSLLPADQGYARDQIALLNDPKFSVWTANRFKEMIARIAIVDRDYFKREILSRDGVAVVESSHGILTDRYYGFHPHTSKLRTVPSDIIALLEEFDYDGEIVPLGVTRAYQIRHGAGPMVTEDPALLENLLPGSHKEDNRWQGKVRVGPLDLVALRYAINVCGGPEFFHGLAITWFDQIQANGRWDVCDGYSCVDDPEFFSPQGEILVRRGAGKAQFFHQEKLGQKLRNCQPKLITKSFSADESRENLTGICAGVLEEKLGISVKLISFGPTEDDKVCL